MNQEIFKKQGYCIVKSAISNELRDFVTQYSLFDEMQNFQPDNAQVIGAHSKYGDPAMESMLLHLHKLMEENTGLTLYPTYSFYRVYRNGDELTKHRDRPSCEISCTVCFNYSYNDLEYTWPIFIDNSKVILNPGDLVIYRGCDLNHWREPFDIDKDAWHVQGFFHYVNAEGPYADYKYDCRTTIGEINADLLKTKRLSDIKTNCTNENYSKSYIKYT
jgi:hypothetical protein